MPRIEHKSIPFEVKAVADDGAHGTFEGLGACFLNCDATGDIIAPGAFKAGLDRFVRDGFIGGVGHDWANPIGHPAEAKEVPEGLWIKGVYDGSPEAQSARSRMTIHPATGRATIRKLSIGYRAVESKAMAPAEVKGFWQSAGYRPTEAEVKAIEARKSTRLLKAVDLFEVSPVLIPANDRAAISAVKAFGGMAYAMPGMGADPDDIEDALRDSVVSVIQGFLCRSLCAIVSNDMLPGDDRLAMIGPAFDRCRDATVQYLKPLMGGEPAEDVMEDVADTLEKMAIQIISGHELPEFRYKSVLERAASARSFADRSRMVASAEREALSESEALFETFQRLHAAREVKESREVSRSNWAALNTHHEEDTQLHRRKGELLERQAEFLERTKPKPKAESGNSPFGGQPAGVMTTPTLGGPAKSASDSVEGASPAADAEPEVKATSGVIPFATGPTMDGAWDGAAADVRVRKWASPDGSGDKDKVDWGRYAKAFAYVDAEGAGSSFGAYHLQHHDVDDGTLKVHRRGLAAAAGIVRGARGGAKFVEGLPAGAADGIRAHLGKHYEQFDETAPWDGGEGKSASDGPAPDPPADPSPPAAPPRVPPGEVKGFFTAYIDTIVAPGLGIATHGR